MRKIFINNACLSYAALKSLIVMIFVVFLSTNSCYGEKAFDHGEKSIELLQLQSTKVKDAARMISEFTGVNIVVTKSAGEVEVDLYLQNTSVKGAVEIICRTVSLAHQHDEENDVYYIMTIEQYTQDLVVVKEEVEVIELKFSRVSMIAEAVSNLYPEQVMLKFIESAAADQEQGARSRLGGLGGGGSGGVGGVAAGGLGGAGLGNLGSQSLGGTSQGSSSAGGMNLGPRVNLNQQLSSVLTSSRISDLEKSQYQESDSDDKHLGLDVNKPVIRITAIDENNMLIIKSTDKKTVGDILKLIESLDIMVPQVFLKMSIYKITHEEGQGQGIDWEFSAGSRYGAIDGNGDVSIVREHDVKTAKADFLDSTLVYRYVTDDLLARLNLFKKKNLVEVVSSPLIMSRNNESTRLFIGTEMTLVTGFDNQTNINQNIATTTTTVETEKRDVGNTLLITPKINSNNTVDLKLELDYSTVIRNGASIPVPINEGTSIGAYSIDVVETTQMNGKVTGKHGVTMAIGGLMGNSESDNNKEVPYLSGIPILKHLFNVDSDSQQRSEMIVLVTPYLMENSDVFDMESLGRLSEYDLGKKLNGADSSATPEKSVADENNQVLEIIEQKQEASSSLMKSDDAQGQYHKSVLASDKLDGSKKSKIETKMIENTRDAKGTDSLEDELNLDEDELDLSPRKSFFNDFKSRLSDRLKGEDIDAHYQESQRWPKGYRRKDIVYEDF
jgi:general secretion pathway protein D